MICKSTFTCMSKFIILKLIYYEHSRFEWHFYFYMMLKIAPFKTIVMKYLGKFPIVFLNHEPMHCNNFFKLNYDYKILQFALFHLSNKVITLPSTSHLYSQ